MIEFLLAMLIYATGMQADTATFIQPGLYKSENIEDFFYAEMTLNEEGTYAYQGRWGLFNFVSSGEWYLLDGQRIVFESYWQNLDSIEIMVEEKFIPDMLEVRVSIQNSQGKALSGLAKFNNNDSLICSSGRCYVDQVVELRSLRVNHLQYSSKTYFIKDEKSNDFDIKFLNMIDGGGAYEFFMDTGTVNEGNLFHLRSSQYSLVEE